MIKSSMDKLLGPCSLWNSGTKIGDPGGSICGTFLSSFFPCVDMLIKARQSVPLEIQPYVHRLATSAME